MKGGEFAGAYLAHVLLLLTLLHRSRFLVQALFLLNLGLRSVLVEQLECLGGGIAVKGVLELGDRRGDFETHVQDFLLALQTNVLRPSVPFCQIIFSSFVHPFASIACQVEDVENAYFTMRERLRLGWIS
jgi:hypothetical protein